MFKKSGDPARKKKVELWLYLLFVLATSFFTYMYRYDFPQSPFWDEPYHIASAQKYLNKVFFMEPHPPLGKLLIAAGEKIVHANEINNQYIGTDYARDIPAGFSFTGYRLFPSLFGWLTAPLLFFIFLFLAGSPALAALFSFLYVFNNAIIVHSRGAMVDSPLVFFGMACVLLFMHLQKKPAMKSLTKFCILSLLFGAFFGLATTTKEVSLIFILLVPALLVRLYPDWQRIGSFSLLSFLGFLITFVAVWQIHFGLSQRLVPELNTQGYYLASDQYKKILDAKAQWSVVNFPVMLRDSLKYTAQYNNGVPRLDLCKADENGSPSYFWPFGGRTINYRWEQASEGVHRYLYLVPNPVAWWLGVFGVAGALMLLTVPFFFTVKEKLQHHYLLAVFFGIYASYMIAVALITRVMYLYHYFIPLVMSFLLFAIVIINLPRIGKIILTEDRRIFLMTILGFLIFVAFQWYRPFSYYEPISTAAVKSRSFMPLWELTCVGCEKKSGLVIPMSKQ